MAYDFANDPNCVALYLFNTSPGLTADSKGSNTLTARSTPELSSTYTKEGDKVAYCASGEMFSRTDADLSADFPFKNGTSNNKISVTFWLRAGSISNQYLVSKYDIGANKRSLAIRLNSSSDCLQLLVGISGGSDSQTYNLAEGLAAGRWYHVGFTYDDTTRRYYCRVYDDSTGLFQESVGQIAANILVFDCGFGVAGCWNSGSPYSLYTLSGGYIDQVAIFNDILTIAEINQIRDDNDVGVSPAFTQVYGSSLGLLDPTTIEAKTAALCSLAGWTYNVFGTTEQGRNIPGIIINGSSYAKTVFIQGGIHGLTVEAHPSLYVYEFACYLYLNQSAIQDGVRYIIIPIINIDGQIANSRKNRNDTTNDGLTPFPRYVDLNRNFPSGWDHGDSSPTSSYYHGPQSLSESEAQTINDVFEDYSPSLYLDCHSDNNHIMAQQFAYKQRKTLVDAALTLANITLFDFVGPRITGEAVNHAAIAHGIESYLVEVALTVPDQEQANRVLTSLLVIIDSWNNDEPATKNDFSEDPTCVAAYRFDPSQLEKDELNKNNLVAVNFPQVETQSIINPGFLVKRGTDDKGSYLYIDDANLSSDFPYKVGGLTTNFSITAYFRRRGSHSNYKYIVSKYDTNNKRSWALSSYYNSTTKQYELRFMIAASDGLSSESIIIHDNLAIDTNYFVAVTFDASSGAWTVQLINVDTDTEIANNSGTTINRPTAFDSKLMIGGAYAPTLITSDELGIGEVNIFNEVISSAKISQIYADEYSAGGGGGDTPTEVRQDREDISGNNRDLSDIGDVPTGNVQGKIGNAAYFSGSGEQLLTLESAPDLTSDVYFTIALKVKPHRNSNPAAQEYWHLTIGDLEIRVGFNPGETDAFVSVITPSLTSTTDDILWADAWSLVTIYFNGSGLYVDIDNENEASALGASTGIVTPATTIEMGFDATKVISMTVDEVGIWIDANALSPSERTTLYNGNYGQRPTFAS